MKRRQFCNTAVAAAAILLVGPMLGGGAYAQGAPVEGKQYARLATAVPLTVPAGKIEVIEFFSYACPHCSALEPSLQAWTKQLPADVVFRRIPVPFLANAENFQRLYFTLELLGAVDKAHAQIFQAVHIEHKRFDKPEEMAALVAKYGVDPAKFMDTFMSFGVQTKVQQSKQAMTAYQINSVPAIAVQGRFLASGEGGAHGPAMLPVADFLIQRARMKS